MNVQIKICGIKDSETAAAAAEAGADLLGVVFVASRRQVTPQIALDITRTVSKLEYQPRIVGIFVNTPVEQVNEIAAISRLDMVQLSGDESPQYCTRVSKPVIKVFHISPSSTAQKILLKMTDYAAVEGLTFMLDTAINGKYGGTGQTFDLAIAKEVSQHFPVFIAGGLTPENVGSITTEIKPLGVDVSGGVETNGRKDIEKIKRFIEMVRDRRTL
jgi:phosphoribosylanthranilate isomerase